MESDTGIGKIAKQSVSSALLVLQTAVEFLRKSFQRVLVLFQVTLNCDARNHNQV